MTAGDAIVSTRAFDAPRELVFTAWTDPDHLAKWWGPKGIVFSEASWSHYPKIGNQEGTS